jgi:anionic cell wall polymer biosynthesis LytR-Cps2A-Psr (LCP) family protein
MTTKALKRGFLMIAGILSVVVIVLTQSFYQPTESLQKKAKTEQADQNSKEVSIHAPSDMVPHGNTVAVNENTPSIAEKIGSTDEPKNFFHSYSFCSCEAFPFVNILFSKS